MIYKYSIKIEYEFLAYESYELEEWRLGNPQIVPQYALEWKGTGLGNGYGYGEFFVKRYLDINGSEVIVNNFNIISNKSKSVDNNKRIEDALGKSSYEKVHKALARFYKNKIKIENPDLCILKLSLYFAEAKKGTDHLRDPQVAFAIAIWEILKIPFKVYQLVPNSSFEGKTSIYREHEINIPINLDDLLCI